MPKEILSQIGNVAARVVFGPEINGTVVDVLKDKNAPVTHILIKTDEGAWRHLMHNNRALVVSGNGLGISEPWWKPGDRYQAQGRGTGMILLPGSRVARNPFNLAKGKPTTPIPDDLQGTLDSAGIEDL